MIRVLAASLLVLLTGFSAYGAKTTADEKAIRETVTKFTTAWNQHDAKAMASIWSEDAVAINPTGRRATGRAEIEKLFTDEHTTFMKNSQGTMTVESFRFPKPGVAFVDMTMEVSGVTTPDGKTAPTHKLHVVGLLVKQGKTWWWTEGRPYAFMAPPPEVATTRN